MPDTRSATSAVPPPLPTRARAAAGAAPALPDAALLATPAVAAPASVPVAPPVPAAATPAPVAPSGPGVGGLPSGGEAEAILSAALRGEVDAHPTRRAAAERVCAVLTQGERTALTSGPLMSDPVLLRAAAGLRLRLDLAMASVPPATAPEGAASTLLAEVDAVLAGLKLAAGGAEPAAAAELEPVRLALLDGGVALAGALARAVPEGGAVVVPAAAPAPAQQAARVVSNVAVAEGRPRAPLGLGIALALSVALASGYHVYGRIQRARAMPPAFDGAPAQTIGVARQASKILTALPGKPVDPVELERLRAAERARGNVVREVTPGTWVVEPESQAAPLPGAEVKP